MVKDSMVRDSQSGREPWSRTSNEGDRHSQRRNGEDIPVTYTKNINHRRFAASFRLKEVSSQERDLYRCVTESQRGAGVSNFARLIIHGELSQQRLCRARAGSDAQRGRCRRRSA
ncbi:hypothetical protein COCON_G00000340 [Conger conger]|uniref:Uncharacterized protein n=1 Tax=Conger conger TaxID=82655 RepID=A0A9Q1E0H6_CONCO|nr:hypothetical protein COCON_G00000340 [Conger conger]